MRLSSRQMLEATLTSPVRFHAIYGQHGAITITCPLYGKYHHDGPEGPVWGMPGPHEYRGVFDTETFQPLSSRNPYTPIQT